jgi:hypothetical protein
LNSLAVKGPRTGRYTQAFVGRDRFHQRDELTLHRLVLDLAVGAQQAEAEGRIEEQQALDFARLVVAVIEEGTGTSRAEAIC